MFFKHTCVCDMSRDQQKYEKNPGMSNYLYLYPTTLSISVFVHRMGFKPEVGAAYSQSGCG